MKKKVVAKAKAEVKEVDWGDDFSRGYRARYVMFRALEAGAEPYCDAAGSLRLALPPAKGDAGAKGDKGTRRTLFIRSRETAAWLATLFFDHHWLPPTPSELAEALLILEGKALANEVPLDLADAIEREPLLETVVVLCDELDDGAEWQGTATELLRELRQRADGLALRVERNERWPKDGSHLSGQLKIFSAQIAEAGIEYDVTRTTNQRLHTLRRKPAEMTA